MRFSTERVLTRCVRHISMPHSDGCTLSALACAHTVDAYRKKIDSVRSQGLATRDKGCKHLLISVSNAMQELAKMDRIRSMQQRAVALVGTGIAAAFVSVGNVTDVGLAAVILVVTIVCLSLIAMGVIVCIRRMRK